jgi:hypothetical protein
MATFSVLAGKYTREEEQRAHRWKQKAREATEEPFSGLQIHDRLVAEQVVADKFGQSFSRIEYLRHDQQVSTPCPTAGVLTHTQSRIDKNGNGYSLWVLSDLALGGHEHIVTVFLFGQAHEDLRRELPGGVWAVLDAEASLDTHSTALNRPIFTCNQTSQLWKLGTSWDYSPVCDWTALGDPTRCTRHVVQSASGTRCTFHCRRQPGLAHPVASASRSSDPALVSVKSHWYKGDCIMPEGRYYWGASPYDGRCLFTSLVGRQLKPLTRNSTPCTQNPKP